MNQPAKVAIALGSNLGDSFKTIENAVYKLASTPGISLITSSSWYRTAPIGPPQPDYINGCVLLKVQLSPAQLLEKLLEIEQGFGRVRRERWGARTLDLDIIFYEDLIVETPTLEIPHPRMHERAFVLVPLAEIVPEWIHPILKIAIADLIQAVDCSSVQKI